MIQPFMRRHYIGKKNNNTGKKTIEPSNRYADSSVLKSIFYREHL